MLIQVWNKSTIENLRWFLREDADTNIDMIGAHKKRFYIQPAKNLKLYKSEKRKMKKGFLLFLITLIVTACSISREQRVDEILERYSGNVPGASLIVIKNGEALLKKAYGIADLKRAVKITSKTNFRLASITKQFTAMCIMILVEQSKLKYDDTLTEIFKEFPDYGKEISITHLLQHTSGLIAYEDLLDDSVTVQVLDKDVLEMMMKQDSTYYQPGLRYRYSNSGYAVLAMIIKKVSGITFAQFLNKKVFKPLDMQNSMAFESGISVIKKTGIWL